MSKVRRLFVPLALALAVVAAVGCSTLPTAPAVNNSANQAQVMDATGAESNGLLGSIGGLVGDLVGLVVRTLNLVGSLGGSLSNGRWRLEIPANAIEGTATVALGVADAQSANCALDIMPASKNHFDRPVLLIANCGNVSDAQLRNYVILWYNPATKQWVPVEGSTVNLQNRTVSAPLAHFSKYACGPAPGKAGW